ncbi:hypothetical protein NBRC10513v2_007145 [Rhodotorula toruloides]|uniref:BY PROTMAP: gi/472582411/gb/EMS20097.1/ transformer-SR ribonucleoprotein [Rhodosporidium toruloides NP11] gi/647402461/emb/CDR48717.1/ RHTO0S19e03136g1_1 [Rhodosporidium toruloides] n=1 Tax=Rhodotorula toruloides TaxID=5286 RepID=A0A0K3CLN8_RHOTO|nr:hypothetical protein AAT19DRAFT_10742 [Rhodotorula toruloides]
MADEYGTSNGNDNRSPSPRRGDSGRGRSRSRSPVRMDTDRRDGGDRGRGDVRGAEPVNPGNNLHVSGLSLKVEERDLEELFSKHGRIQKCQVMRDPHSKESRGFAFVMMETGEEADACIAALNATEVLGRTINVEKARRGRARTPTPGQYHGPPKRYDAYGGGPGYGERPYDPRGYGGRGYDRYSDRGGRYDDPYDRRGPPPSYGGRDRYDDYPPRSRYDDRDRGSYAVPMRGGDDRRGGGYGGEDRYSSRSGGSGRDYGSERRY